MGATPPNPSKIKGFRQSRGQPPEPLDSLQESQFRPTTIANRFCTKHEKTILLFRVGRGYDFTDSADLSKIVEKALDPHVPSYAKMATSRDRRIFPFCRGQYKSAAPSIPLIGPTSNLAFARCQSLSTFRCQSSLFE